MPTSRSRLALLALVSLVAAGCTASASPVRVATVGRADVAEIVEAPATVVARATTVLSAAADGRVAELRVADGQSVRAGQVLAIIDSPQARLRLVDARRADAEAAASAPSGGSSLGLSQSMAESDAAALRSFAAARAAAARLTDPQQRQQAEAAVAQAEAQYAVARAQAMAALTTLQRGVGSLSRAAGSLAAAQRVQTRAAVNAAQRTVDALTVVAPMSGVVSLGSASGDAGGGGGLLGSLPPEISALLGGAGTRGGGSGASSSVTGGGTAVAAGVPVQAGAPLLTVTDLSALSLTAEVDETDVFLVKPGVKATVELDAVPGARYSAVVVSVDLSPATSARGGVTYRVRLRLGAGTGATGDPAPRPRPGMSAVADLTVRFAQDAIALPASAIIRDGARDAVWVSVEGKAVRRFVTLGAEGDDMVAVLSGVAEGDRVVVRGADTVRAGQKLPT